MKKILLSITDQQKLSLKRDAKRHGVSVSEYIRRILDLFFSQAMNKIKLTTFDKVTDIEVPNSFIEIAKKHPNIFQINENK